MVVGLYGSSIVDAVTATPERYRLALLPTFLPQAATLMVLAWLVSLPVSRWPRAYRYVAPGVLGLATAVLALDSRVYEQVRFHLNGFFLRVAVQPDALRVTGVPLSHVLLFLGAAAAFVAADIAAGAWFISRRAAPRRTWRIALALLLLGGAERVYGSALTYLAGPAVFAASTVVPQVPVRMRTIFRKVFGTRTVDQFAGNESLRLPVGVPATEFEFARKPDVLLVIGESLPADHFAAETMPRLWQRVEQGGARFTRAYSGACSTSYSLFSLLYGLQPQKL